MTHATYGPGSRSRARRLGRRRMASVEPTGINIEVYFDEKARPSATPLAHHQPSDDRDPIGDCIARTTAYTPNAVVARRGASGVASTSPAAASGMHVMTVAARSALSLPASWRAIPAVASAAKKPASTEKNRTPNGAS